MTAHARLASTSARMSAPIGVTGIGLPGMVAFVASLLAGLMAPAIVSDQQQLTLTLLLTVTALVMMRAHVDGSAAPAAVRLPAPVLTRTAHTAGCAVSRIPHDPCRPRAPGRG